jgi:hypothetical protein
VFSFPNPVNEKAARVVAGVVMVVALIALLTSAYWLLILLAYGFWARVLTGPTLSPLGQFATRVAAPRLGEPKYVPGPPKRFAQGMGAVITTTALVLWLAGATTAVDVLLIGLVAAAGLESILAYCVGCKIFGICALRVSPAGHPARRSDRDGGHPAPREGRAIGRPARVDHQPARPGP